ncbi:hypothetical protein SEA_POKYPUPPY_60 [Gordonia phage PokyPuppy]|nr:hypothetical protein SEA_POKYPUPPY_60 [Gordonia phage PokyPuppy]
MADEDIPEEFKQAVEFQRFQQKQYEEASRRKEEVHNADLAAFASFIDDLTDEQVDYLHDLIGELGQTGYSFKLQGIIVGSRVYRRGRMVDGQTYEQALGLGGAEDKPGDHVFDNISKSIDELSGSRSEAPALSGPLEGDFYEEEMIPPKPPEPKMVSDTRTYDVGYGVTAIKHGKQPLMCAQCGKPYASIEDMKEHVERDGGCKGCQNKMKWG